MKIVNIFFLVFLFCNCSFWRAERIIQVWDEQTNIVMPIEKLSSVSRSEWMTFFDEVQSKKLRSQVIDFALSSSFLNKKVPLFIFEKHSQGRSFYTVYLCPENGESCIYSYSSDRETIFDNVKVVSADPFHHEMDRVNHSADIDSLAVNFTIISKLTATSVDVREVVFY